jgi:ferric-dicitrate binding protein FerR (iron transport regulator)
MEELIEDKQFIAWVLKGSKNSEWHKFIKYNPEINSKVKKAREIVLLLRDTYEVMDEESVLKMWQNIDQFDHRHNKKVRAIKFRRKLSWAASILLIISLGTFGYYNFLYKNKSYQFVSSEIANKSDEARIVLSDGEEVILTSANSTISINNNELVIDNDSAIDLSQKEIEQGNEARMNEVVIPYGKSSELLLADGTKVWLNAGSKFAFPSKFKNKNREVFLEGEAYFEVARNEEQPFIVNAAEMGIKVLGTHFNVSAYATDKNIETVLLEGSIALSNHKSLLPGTNEVLLQPYQRATFNKENKDIKVFDEPDADIFIVWTEGLLQFSQGNLQSVFTKLERYYNIKIDTPKDFPSSEVITGKLDLKESLEDVMIALSDVANLDYRIYDNRVVIDKRLKKIVR